MKAAIGNTYKLINVPVKSSHFNSDLSNAEA